MCPTFGPNDVVPQSIEYQHSRIQKMFGIFLFVKFKAPLHETSFPQVACIHASECSSQIPNSRHGSPPRARRGLAEGPPNVNTKLILSIHVRWVLGGHSAGSGRALGGPSCLTKIVFYSLIRVALYAEIVFYARDLISRNNIYLTSWYPALVEVLWAKLFYFNGVTVTSML